MFVFAVTNPSLANVQIYAFALDIENDLHTLRWNGSTWTTEILALLVLDPGVIVMELLFLAHAIPRQRMAAPVRPSLWHHGVTTDATE